MQKIWLKSYPAGVPEDIDGSAYPSRAVTGRWVTGNCGEGGVCRAQSICRAALPRAADPKSLTRPAARAAGFFVGLRQCETVRTHGGSVPRAAGPRGGTNRGVARAPAGNGVGHGEDVTVE